MLKNVLNKLMDEIDNELSKLEEKCINDENVTIWLHLKGIRFNLIEELKQVEKEERKEEEKNG